jgi:ribosomal protein S18 acetylase RimI-like enzyme
VAGIREIELGDLFAVTEDPFVRHQVDPDAAKRAWVNRRATVISGGRGRPREVVAGPVYTCIGPVEDLEPLMRHVAEIAEPAWRVTNVTEADAAVPPSWRRPRAHRWHWMLTRIEPPAALAEQVEAVADVEEIDAVLDAANADSFARPGAPGIELWAGVRDAGRLVGVGALMRLPDGTGHLRGVGVLPSARGRGIGTAISAALTLRGFANGSDLCTLGVYTDNAAAIAMYERLGYSTVHTFTSGVVAAR